MEQATDVRAPEEDDELNNEASPVEDLRRRIFEARARGLTWAAISKMVGRTIANCRIHYKKAREEIVHDIAESGWKSIAGGRIRELEWAKQQARSHLAALEAGELDEQGRTKPGSSKKGSLQAAIWMQTYLRALKQQQDYELEIGFVQRASDKLDITVKDARSMSIEELQNECALLEQQLAGARIVSDKSPLLRRVETIEATATVKALEDPRSVERAAAKIEKLDREE